MVICSWKILVSMPSGEVVDPPYSLKASEENELDQGLEAGVDAPPVAKTYEGVFYNYLSIGMDAQVAYGFHHLRNTKPYLAQGPISNKVCVLLSSAKLEIYLLLFNHTTCCFRAAYLFGL